MSLCTCPLGTPRAVTVEDGVEISVCSCCGEVEVDPVGPTAEEDEALMEIAFSI
jgi:hypothetical protein